MPAKYNIKVQYAAGVAVVSIGMSVALTALHIWRVVDDQEHSVRWLAQHQAKTVARIIAHPLSRNDVNALAQLAADSVTDEEVLYLRVLNANGEPLFRLPHSQEPSKLVVVTAPVEFRGAEIGTVELGMGRGRMAQRVWGALIWDVGVAALLTLLFVTASGVIVKPVQESLQNLLNYIRGLAIGEHREESLDTDLSEVDNVGRELKKLTEQVEEARERLERAQAQLKATQREMDEYTYVISHDLKEPLRGMEAFSQFLADRYRDKLDEDGRRHIDIIRKSVLRMQRMINDLLHFSRISQQKQTLQPVGMNTVVLHVRVRLQQALESKQADLRVDRLPTVVCDETAMTEVFHNLISNALKYNDKPHPVIEIGCTETLHPETQQPEYQFFVRDNGIGIKKEYFEKIFQIFQRLHRDEEGTGIGLTIVRRVIEAHGGRIWLESEEGKGTTFYFTLPKREVTSTGQVAETATESQKGVSQLATPV